MKFYLTNLEVGWMKQHHPKLYENMQDVIEEYNPQQLVARADLLHDLNERLGRKTSGLGYGMASDQDISGVSHLGARADYVLFDETHNLTEVYESGEPGIVAQKWLEHRRTCRRTLLECLSGETH